MKIIPKEGEDATLMTSYRPVSLLGLDTNGTGVQEESVDKFIGKPSK